jgi:asparagine N-glycosylation enzyme membrane subunit Stt3
MSAGAVKTSLTYLTVTDSDASSSDISQVPILPTNSTNGGHTLMWFTMATDSSWVQDSSFIQDDDFIQDKNFIQG